MKGRGGGGQSLFHRRQKNHDLSVIAPFLMSDNAFKQCDSAVFRVFSRLYYFEKGNENENIT